MSSRELRLAKSAFVALANLRCINVLHNNNKSNSFLVARRMEKENLWISAMPSVARVCCMSARHWLTAVP